MSKNQINLTAGNPIRHLFNLSWPMSFGILAVISTSLVDTYYVGQLGTEQLAALSFTFPVALAINSISIGFGVGTSSVISRIIGSGDKSMAKRVATDSLVLSTFVISFCALIGSLTIAPLFSLMGAEGVILEYIKEYMYIWFLSLPVLVIPMVSGSIIRALGDSFWPSLQMVFSAILNIIMTPLFMFGSGPIPAYGVKGAAIGTTVAWCVTLFMALWLIAVRENMITFEKVSLKQMIESWKKVVNVGIPSAISQVIHPVSIALITSFIASYGADSVAAFGVGTRIESILLIPLFALSAGIPPIAGQNWGAKKIDRIKKTLNFSCLLCLIWGAISFITIYFWGESIVQIFSKNIMVQKSAIIYIDIVIMTIAGYGLVMCSSAVFNAIGKPLISFSFSFLRSFVFYIPLSFLAYKLSGETSIFYAIAAANILSGLIAFFTSRNQLQSRESVK